MLPRWCWGPRWSFRTCSYQ